jgi:integrase
MVHRMSDEIVVGKQSELATPIDAKRLAQHAAELRDASVSKSTRRVYESYWEQFCAFCAAIGASALPAPKEALLAFLAHLSDQKKKNSTIYVAASAIRRAHDQAGIPCALDDRDARDVLRGVSRRKGGSSKGKREIRLDDLRAMLGKRRDGVRGIRDTAILLLGWWAALRRSEIVALDVENVHFTEEGMEIRFNYSKTNQMGKREEIVGVPYASDLKVCPVRALKRWLSVQANPPSGPIFTSVRGSQRLSDIAVWKIVKEYANRAGLNPHDFGAHSLRSGFATEAARAKKRPDAIKDHLRHGSIETTMKYIRREDVWEDNAATGLA